MAPPDSGVLSPVPALSSDLPVLDPSPSPSWSSAPGRVKQNFLSPTFIIELLLLGARKQVNGAEQAWSMVQMLDTGSEPETSTEQSAVAGRKGPQPGAHHSPGQGPSTCPCTIHQPHHPPSTHSPTQSTTTSNVHTHPSMAPHPSAACPATCHTGSHPPVPTDQSPLPSHTLSFLTPSHLPPLTICFHVHPHTTHQGQLTHSPMSTHSPTTHWSQLTCQGQTTYLWMSTHHLPITKVNSY